MYLKRKADTFLANWKKEEKRMPLIVRGARQVGKTEAIRHFSANYYRHIVEINFVEEPQYKGSRTTAHPATGEPSMANHREV